MGYATPGDVFDLGFKAEAFASRPRPVEVVDVPSGIFRLRSHGFDPSDVLTWDTLPPPVLGLPAPALPAGLSMSIRYFPLILTGDIFHLSLTVGGSPVVITDAGAGSFAILVDPLRKLQRMIDGTAADIDARLTAHAPPLKRDPSTGLFPLVVTKLNARLAAREAIPVFGLAQPQYLDAIKALDGDLAHDWQKLALWDDGQPINPIPTDQNDEPDNAAFAGNDAAPVGWRTGAL